MSIFLILQHNKECQTRRVQLKDSGQGSRMKSHFQHSFPLVVTCFRLFFSASSAQTSCLGIPCIKKKTPNLSDNVILIEHFKWVNICIVFQGCFVHAKQGAGQKGGLLQSLLHFGLMQIHPHINWCQGGFVLVPQHEE